MPPGNWKTGWRKVLLLAKCRICARAGETLAAYGKRAAGRLDTATGSFADICTLYQSIRFGGEEAGEAKILQLEQYTDSLEKQYLHGCGRLRRLLYHMR